MAAPRLHQHQIVRGGWRAVRKLPSLLQDFLVRYPPGTFSSDTTSPPSTESQRPDPATTIARIAEETRHPFLPWRNPETQRWRDPPYTPWQQRKLYESASYYGLLSLLPQETSKTPDEKLRRRVEEGLKVKGTGVGQRVKGHIWERKHEEKMEMRERALKAMPAMIKEWKVKGHGRTWTKWPSRGNMKKIASKQR